MSSALVAFNHELIALVRRVRQSTATITGYSVDFSNQAVGSGWVCDADGHIVTNHHVIAEIGRKLEVTLAGHQPQDAIVVGSDPDTDLAVLRCATIAVRNIPALVVRHAAAQVGEICLAFGSPLVYKESVNMGIVSGMARQLEREDGKSEESIQVDAAINPGNSGGPLVDIYGEVIGVAVAKRSDAENISFAVPAEMVLDIVPELIAYGAIKRGTLGIRIGAAWARDGSDRQVITVQSLRDTQSPFQIGDEIISINEVPINRRYDVRKLLNRTSIGAVFDVHIKRNDKNKRLRVPINPR